MSGQQIGSAVGFVAGFFLPGGPMVWSAIGGAIGGWISPTQVNGPRIGDGQSQSSAEGMPIPWILGTGPSPIQGQIVQKSPRREIKKTDDGKGSGTEVNTYEAHQDFCILFCESSEHRGSLMKGVLFCLVDGKIMYDMRPEANFAVENAKFLEHHTFYDGNESQMPDPTMEALVGVDFAMYYRGVFTMVARDINLSAYGDRIPVYQVVMVGEGEADTTTVTSLVALPLSGFTDSDFPLADAESDYDLIGYLGVQGVGGTTINHSGESISEIIAYFAAYDFTPHGGGSRNPHFYIGYSASTSNSTNPGSGLSIDDFGVSNAVSQPSVVDNASVVLVYNDLQPTGVHGTFGFSGFCGIGSGVEADKRGSVAEITGSINGQSSLMESCAGDDLRGFFPLCIRATRKAKQFVPQLGDPCVLGEPTLLPDDPGFVQDCDGNVTPVPTYSPVSGSFRQLQVGVTATSGSPPRLLYTKYPLGPVIEATDPDNTQSFWEPYYDAAVAAGTMEPGGVWNVDYPIAINDVTQAEYTTHGLIQDTIGLDTVITRICLRGGLSEDDIDVADMDQQVMGYGVLQPYTGTEALSPLLQGFLSYGSEYDGKLHFHKHGDDVDIVIDPNDFIEGSDETEENTREQQIEYPRLLNVIAIDATQNYTARPQAARRTSPNVRAIGEEAIELAIVLPPDYHAQLADIGLKVMWARAQGPRKFSVPFAQSATYLKLVPGMPFGLDGKRYIVDKQRIGAGEIEFEAVYDRQSAYTSDVTAVPALPPTPPPSNIAGVTLFAAMNLPRLRSRDNVPGMYVAVAGLLESWPGCYLQLSIDDEATWSTPIASMTQPSVIGILTADMGAGPGETISTAVHGGQLVSITSETIANGGNPSAIVTAGVAEVLQFQDADETDPDQYDLTTLVRGGLGTLAASHFTGDRFVQLEHVYFLPLDINLAGRTIKLRPVTFGTPPDSNAVYEVIFSPLFTGPQIVEAYVNESGDPYTTEAGSPYYRVTN